MTKNLYQLGCSCAFDMMKFEERIVNLSLEKQPIPTNTWLKGNVFYREKPVNKATVEVLDLHGYPLFHTATDHSGFYELKNILRPGAYKVLVSHDNYKTSPYYEVKIECHAISNLDVPLKPSNNYCTGTVYGNVTDACTGRYLANVVIALICKKSGNVISTTLTNDLGQYLLYQVCPKDYWLTVKRHGYKKNKVHISKEDSQKKLKINSYLAPCQEAINTSKKWIKIG
jgi:hypothetical protein